MKKKKAWKIIVPIAIVVVIIGVTAVNNARSAGEAAAKAMEVEAITVETGDVSETNKGRVIPRQ